ncbi:unnamed protein product, partial [Polarella glacialis]
MAVSPLQRAKRAFVIVLQSIAAAYSVQLDVTRESADNLVTSAFRRVAQKVHPDKGGKLVDSQRLLAARQVWEDALRAASANGRPVSGKSSATSSSQFYLSWGAESRRECRIQSEAALLTYQGFNGLDHWRRFVSFVASSFKRWRVKHWCATLETNTDGTDHAHLMLQFTQVVDRITWSFIFEGLRPNVATTDLGGEGFCKKRMQQSINREMFYVWANKVGTQLDETGAQCLAGNYGPVWSTAPFRYQVLGAWPELQKPLRAKRAFVIVLQSIAAAYSVPLDVTRESADNLVTSAFRRVAKKVHPDKGGKLVASQRLLAARQVWEDALRAASANGRPVSGKSSATSSSQFYLSWGAESRREFRIQSEARWRVKHWCATLETNTDGTDHVHLMLQFPQVVDRTTRSFIFEGLRPNVATTDLGGEGFCKKRMQQSINRGMFYVWANKVGTQFDETGAQCLAGNYGPVWSTAPFRYQVLGAWPELQKPLVWEDALRAASANGRPVSGKSSATSSSQFYLSWGAESRREFRIQSEAALLTYQGFNGLDHWRRFVSSVASSFKRWRVKHWCATLETNADGTDHAHLMLQFTQVVDRTTRSFIFEGLRPNVATTDLGGEGFCKKRMQQSINRGISHVWANKVGTQLDETGAQCLAGNYGPVWSTAPFRYQVLGAWPELQKPL